jgi:hypothetical protein
MCRRTLSTSWLVTPVVGVTRKQADVQGAALAGSVDTKSPQATTTPLNRILGIINRFTIYPP